MEVREFEGTPRSIAVRLDPGEEVLPALESIAEKHDVRAGFVTVGIGSLRDTTLGYFDGERYLKRELKEPHELLGLSGSIARWEGRPHIHLHATLSDRACQSVGGHFHGGTVEILAEILVQAFRGEFGRVPHGELLKVLTLHPAGSEAK